MASQATVLNLTDPIVAPFRDLEGTAILHDTGVVEFATLTAMEAVLDRRASSPSSCSMFWSEFLHMYRRIRDFFVGAVAAPQSAHRQSRTRSSSRPWRRLQRRLSPT